MLCFLDALGAGQSGQYVDKYDSKHQGSTQKQHTPQQARTARGDEAQLMTVQYDSAVRWWKTHDTTTNRG